MNKFETLLNVNTRSKDQYVNATKLCKGFDKLIGHWRSNKDTKDFLNELSDDIGIPISKLVDVKRGGNCTDKQNSPLF